MAPYEALFIEVESSLMEKVLIFGSECHLSTLQMSLKAAVGISLRQTVQVGHRVVWEFGGEVRISSTKDLEEQLVKGTDSVEALKAGEISLGGRCVDVYRAGEDELAHGRGFGLMECQPGGALVPQGVVLELGD